MYSDCDLDIPRVTIDEISFMADYLRRRATAPIDDLLHRDIIIFIYMINIDRRFIVASLRFEELATRRGYPLKCPARSGYPLN